MFVEGGYHVLTWSVTIVSCIPAIATDDYGPAGSWCWIKGNYYGDIWRFVTFYIPLYCYLAFNLLVFCVILYLTFTRRHQHSSSSHLYSYSYSSSSSSSSSFMANNTTTTMETESKNLPDRLQFGRLILFPIVYIALWFVILFQTFLFLKGHFSCPFYVGYCHW